MQILLYFDWCLSAVVLLFTFVFYLFKLYSLPYPEDIFAVEISLFIVFCILQYFRLEVGQRSNKTESRGFTILLLLLSIVSFLGNIFFLVLQTYMYLSVINL